MNVSLYVFPCQHHLVVKGLSVPLRSIA